MINIAFSFDKNYYKPALVAISSLLYYGQRDHVVYHIYCLIKNDVSKEIQSEIYQEIITKSPKSKITFINTEQYFKNAYEIRNISTAAYSRLILYLLLPSVDKIIYSDVDVLFKDSLKSIWNVDLSQYYYAGVKDISINTNEMWSDLEKRLPYWKKEMSSLKGNYHQSGFLVLNLRNWRKENLERKIMEMSSKCYYYQDMDILNLIFKQNQDKILTIPPKYIFMPKHDYETAKDEKIISQKEYEEIKKEPAIIHYSGEKPWNNSRVVAAHLWWDFVKEYTSYFTYFLNNLKLKEEQRLKEFKQQEKKKYKFRIHVFNFDIVSKKKEGNKRIYKLLGVKLEFKK